MPAQSSSEPVILIRCPSCGQRFRVSEDLVGRPVECGACENRFRITEDVIIRGRKVYPGERNDKRLDFFQRVPIANAPSMGAGGFAPLQYDNSPDPSLFEPSAPQRIIAGMMGVGVMLFIGMLLIFGASRGGVLDGMVTPNRMVMGGFAGVLGTALLMYANPMTRIRFLAVGILCTLALVSLPLFLKGGSTPLGEGVVVKKVEVEAPKKIEEAPDLVELRNRLGTQPLEEEIARLKADGSTRNAVGLWLRDLREQNRFLIRDYVLRVTGADPQSHYYPRGGGDFLMVVTGITTPMDELVQLCKPLGEVVMVHSALPVLEIKVRNENFVENQIDKLSNKADPDFYTLNLAELNSIDLDRMEKAVKRLMESSPKILRTDITQRLIELLVVDEVEFKGEICSALAVWSESPGPAGTVALKEASKLVAKDLEVPKEMIALVVKEGITDVAEVLDKLWQKNPTNWESLYADVGPTAERGLLAHVGINDEGRRRSLVRILGKVGGNDSLQALESIKTTATEPELKILIDNSLEAIRSRISQ